MLVEFRKVAPIDLSYEERKLDMGPIDQLPGGDRRLFQVGITHPPDVIFDCFEVCARYFQPTAVIRNQSPVQDRVLIAHTTQYRTCVRLSRADIATSG